jgi:HEAT repeat protein
MSLFGPPDIAKLKAKRDVEGLVKALGYRKDQGGVRKDAIVALGEIGDPRAVEPLIAALDDEQTGRAAMKALGQIGDPRAVEPLIVILTNEHQRPLSRGRDAAEALGEIGDPRAVGPLIAAAHDVSAWGASSDALGKIGAPAVEPLIAALKDGNTTAAIAAAMALGAIGDPSAVEPLIEVLTEAGNDGQSRRAAGVALSRIGDARAIEPIIAAVTTDLTDPSLAVRMTAVMLLGWTGDPRAIAPLSVALNDEHEGVRQRAAEELKKIGGATAAGPAVSAVEDRHDLPHGSAAMPPAGKSQNGDKTCSACGSRIDHFGFLPADVTYVMSADKDATIAWMRGIGGKCPECGTVCCSICYRHNGPKEYACPSCGAKIPDLS